VKPSIVNLVKFNLINYDCFLGDYVTSEILHFTRGLRATTAWLGLPERRLILGDSLMKHGGFRPVCPKDEPSKADGLAKATSVVARRSSVLEGIIDVYDTTPCKIAYWEREQHREAQPSRFRRTQGQLQL
jgi:hypothetical protein